MLNEVLNCPAEFQLFLDTIPWGFSLGPQSQGREQYPPLEIDYDPTLKIAPFLGLPNNKNSSRTVLFLPRPKRVISENYDLDLKLIFKQESTSQTLKVWKPIDHFPYHLIVNDGQRNQTFQIHRGPIELVYERQRLEEVSL